MMVAAFGTMAADGVRRGAGVTYAVTTPLFALATAAIFALWYRSEGTLSIHSITTRRRETFYWATVLATFALGTAAGDLTAFTLHLGFFASILLFAAIIAVPAVGWWRGALNPTVAFWAAYVVTRPLGASIADWFAKPTRLTGLGVGDAAVSAVALAMFVALVPYAAVTRRDVQRSELHGRSRGHAAGLDSVPGSRAPSSSGAGQPKRSSRISTLAHGRRTLGPGRGDRKCDQQVVVQRSTPLAARPRSVSPHWPPSRVPDPSSRAPDPEVDRRGGPEHRVRRRLPELPRRRSWASDRSWASGRS